MMINDGEYLLVGGRPTPLKNRSSSVGMIIPNIWKNKKCSKPPTSWGCQQTSDKSGIPWKNRPFPSVNAACCVSAATPAPSPLAAGHPGFSPGSNTPWPAWRPQMPKVNNWRGGNRSSVDTYFLDKKWRIAIQNTAHLLKLTSSPNQFQWMILWSDAPRNRNQGPVKVQDSQQTRAAKKRCELILLPHFSASLGRVLLRKASMQRLSKSVTV